MLELFKNANFSRLFWARLITNAGDSLYFVAAMWLVHELGGSSFYTGLAGFLTLIPQTLQFLSGPLVDRWPLRRTLVGAEVAQGVLVLIVPAAAALGWLSVTLVLVVMPLIALVTQFAYPAQSAALPRVIKKEDLVKGNSAFSFAYQGVDMIFSGSAGVLVAAVGAVAIYVIDSITFMSAALLVAAIRFPPGEGEVRPGELDGSATALGIRSYWADLKEGARYVLGSVLTRIIASVIGVNLMLTATVVAILPAYADSRGGPEMYGAMMAATAAGSLIGALVASKFERRALGSLYIVSFFLSGFAWLVAAFSGAVSLTVVFFGMAWVPIGLTNVVIMAMIQQNVSERLMARVISVIESATAIAMPLGALFGGLAGDRWGPGSVFTASGVTLVVVGLYWLVDPVLRGLPAGENIDRAKYGLVDPQQAVPPSDVQSKGGVGATTP